MWMWAHFQFYLQSHTDTVSPLVHFVFSEMQYVFQFKNTKYILMLNTAEKYNPNRKPLKGLQVMSSYCAKVNNLTRLWVKKQNSHNLQPCMVRLSKSASHTMENPYKLTGWLSNPIQPWGAHMWMVLIGFPHKRTPAGLNQWKQTAELCSNALKCSSLLIRWISEEGLVLCSPPVYPRSPDSVFLLLRRLFTLFYLLRLQFFITILSMKT